MRVYKYFHKKFKSDLIRGFIYLNTFHSIRKVYESGLISDPQEGVAVNRSGPVYIDDSTKPAQQKVIQSLNSDGAITIDGHFGDLYIGGISHKTTLYDAYLYCVTSIRNDDYWMNIPKSQGGPYKGCIEIYDFYDFVYRISGALHNEGIPSLVKIQECFFEDNIGNILDNNIKGPSYFRKPDTSDFRLQKEIRAVFVDAEKDFEKLEPRKVYLSENINKLIKFHT